MRYQRYSVGGLDRRTLKGNNRFRGSLARATNQRGEHMKDDLWYEWKVEFTDEHGDIDDCDHADDYAYVKRRAEEAVRGELCEQAHVCLVRMTGNESEGVTSRAYAYMIDSELPDTFCDGETVPARFHREVAKASRAGAA